MEGESVPVSPEETLFIPQPRRLLHETSSDEGGAKTFHLYYGDLEITFDDPALIPFGEQLSRTTSFTARETMSWATEGTYPWETACELLGTLVEQGLLVRQEPAKPEPARGCPVAHGAPPPVVTSSARTWTPDQCRTLTEEIFGIAVDVGHLESMIRCTRIAHSALDDAGRQLGDENTWPIELRIDMPTEHRPCNYRGSRHQHELPMNVTGLRLVQSCWPEVVQALRVTKQELRSRRKARGPLSLAEIYVYATTVLALPSYLMHRAERPLGNGEIPLSVSALFRAIDGTRITSRHLMLTSDRPASPALLPNVASFFLHAEKEALLIAARGVCAGPPAMIEEFLGHVLSVQTDPAPPGEAPIAALSEIAIATDYALAACEIESIVDQHWLRQAELLDDLRAHLDELRSLDATSEALRRAVTASTTIAAMPSGISHLTVEPACRRSVIQTFDVLIETCRSLRGAAMQSAAEVTASETFDDDVAALHTVIATSHPAMPRASTRATAHALVRLVALEQATLPAMALRQADVNRILGRAQPGEPLTAEAFSRAWAPVSLRRIVREELGLSLVVQAGRPALVLTERPLACPISLDPAGFRALRGLLARSRFSLASILWRVWGKSFDTEVEAATAFQKLVAYRAGLTLRTDDALDVLIRLFVIPAGVSEPALRAHLREDEIAALRGSGLLDLHDGVVTSGYALSAIDGLYVLTDTAATVRTQRDRAGKGPQNDVVMPVYLETYLFAQKTHRHPVTSALDLCTGSGVHALLAARYAERAVGTDISARAVRFAEWNRMLNRVENARFAAGSVWDAVRGEYFDRVTVNPPYQPDSREAPGQNWWGAGPRGDGIVSRILQGVDRHLADDGELQMIGQLYAWDGEPIAHAIARGIGEPARYFDIQHDVDGISLDEVRRKYPDEPLVGLTSAAYGVVTIRRVS